ncbi:thiol peroxidase [Ureaplasma ceti]|uniref:Thiol peroxidase n=1 Tax=Ureaplasma ceti TaxID=3119530 RepID=A0ABP9U7Q3_9BACT
MADFKAENFTLIGNKLEAGQMAPDFQLVDMNGEMKSLKDYEGKIKVISCFPSIDTGVCDAQTRRFAKKYENECDVIVLNVSVDLPFAFQRWCAANEINMVALSDYRTREFGKSYGILMDPYMTLFRSVFVVDKDNKIKLASYNEEVGKPVDFCAVEKAVDELL